MIFDVFDRANRAAKAAKIFVRRLQIHESYQAVFSTPDGQRVLEHMCRVAFVFKTTHVRGDSHESAFREGQRELAISILRHVCKDHGELQQMLQSQLKGMNDAS